MTRDPLSTLARLARANPVTVDDEHRRTTVPRRTLTAILATDNSLLNGSPARRGRQFMILGPLIALLAVGAAFAASDPFGFWRSNRLGTASFVIDAARKVQPPTLRDVDCPLTSTRTFPCAAGLHGRAYELIDHVPAPGPHRLDRARIRDGVATALANGRISPRTAGRITGDLMAVGDRFLKHLDELAQFATFSTSPSPTASSELAPPPGVPALIVCESIERNTLSCAALNGDNHVAVGSGVYEAVPSADWKLAASGHLPRSSQLLAAVFGRPLSQAEGRLLRDLTTIVGGPRTTSKTKSGSPLGLGVTHR
jgi:hypothetical protein